MSFSIKSSEVDLGTTELENMFIQEFMPLANGTHVKVYLLGLYYAKNPKEVYSNESIAKHLGIPLEDVLAAWHFWQSKGIVDCTVPDNPYIPHQFSVQFTSVRETYLSHNFTKLTPNEPDRGPAPNTFSSANRVISALSNPALKDMFRQLEYIVKRPLSPANHIKILDWMSNYRMDPDMIERAFAITYEERPKVQDEPNIDRHFKYIESILSNWFDKGIFTLDALEAEEAQRQSILLHYKAIYSAIGVINRAISSGDKELVDQWSTKLSQETQMFIIKEATKRTTNPNLKYLDRIIQSALLSGVTDIDSARAYFDPEAKPKPPVEAQEGHSSQQATGNAPRIKRSTQNFKQSTISSLSQDELNSIIQRKSERKKKKTEDNR